MGRLGFSVLPLKTQVRQDSRRPLLAPAPALNCGGQFGMELTRLDQASSSFSFENSLRLEDGRLPQSSGQSWVFSSLAHEA